MNFRRFFEGAFFRPNGNINSDAGYLYHATNEDNLMDIVSSGSLGVFGPSHGTDQDVWPDGGDEDRSYWTDKASSAWHFSPENGSPVILRTKNSPSFRMERGTGDYYSVRSVPSNNLEVLMRDGTWMPISGALSRS